MTYSAGSSEGGLRLDLGVVDKERPFMRLPLLEEVVASIPKDPELQLIVYQGELAHGADIPWHIHNGPLICVVLMGECILTFADGTRYNYRAGDVIIEPSGVPHFAYNPNPDVPFSTVALQLTAPGRDHIVNLADVPDIAERPSAAPRGPVEPRPSTLGGLPGRRAR